MGKEPTQEEKDAIYEAEYKELIGEWMAEYWIATAPYDLS